MTVAGLEEWAEAFISECSKRGLGAVGVTDHHDLWPGVIALLKAHQMKAPIWVFPGMEITSKSGIQAILLVDPAEFGDLDAFVPSNAEAVINRITASIGQNITAGAKGERTLVATSWTKLQGLAGLKEDDRKDVFLGPDVERLDRDLEGDDGIVKNLDRVCRDRCLVLPNLEKNKQGVFGNEYGRALYVKAEGWFIGGYVGGPNATDEDAIRGLKVKDFGKRTVVCLKTSDQRGKDSSNWFSDRLGQSQHASWLKLSEPSVKSISQALISGRERRVFEVAPSLPPEAMESLEVSGVEVFGKATVTVPLSPYLSTLIGGRGTGKSLLLSALVRLFGADREWQLKSPDELLPWEARHLALFLEGGPFFGRDVSLAVTFRKEAGVVYRMTLDAPGDALLEHRMLQLKTAEGWQQMAVEAAALTALDFQPLFFLQNQMSAITGSRLEQHDLIKLVEGPIRAARTVVRTNIEKLSITVRDGMEAKSKLLDWKRQARELSAQMKAKDSERQAYLEAAQRGLTTEQQALFTEGESLRKGRIAATNIESAVETALHALTGGLQDLSSTLQNTKADVEALFASKLADFKNDRYLLGLTGTVANLEKDLRALIDKTREQARVNESYKSAHQASIESLIAKAAEMAEKEKTRREALKKAQALESEITELNKQEQKFTQDAQRIERSGNIKRAEEALETYRKLVRDYSEQLQRRAKAINENKEFQLIVRIVPGGQFKGVVEGIRALCEGAGVRSSTWAQMEQVLAESSEPASVITEVCESMIRAIADASSGIPPVWEKLGFSGKIVQNIRTRTTIEQWVKMSVVLADDKVDVLYKRGGGKKPIAILNASPGERAVELLKLALHSTTGPLVIDQPEDDLDNHFLARQLVDLVQDAKKKNQLVFASHNANLVVHGDSEVIHVMDAKEGTSGKVGCTLQLSGTIDQQDICSKVEDVMEGGREAFENRRRKYHETISA